MHDGEISNRSCAFKNPCYIEVKNVTLLGEDNFGLFPDAVSTRGQKHLQQLTELARAKIRSVMLYVINRQDVCHFAPAQQIDPDYARLLAEAHSAGVEVLAYQCRLTANKIAIRNPIPLD